MTNSDLVTKSVLKTELNKVMDKLDAIANTLKSIYEEQTVASYQISNHSDKLDNHEERIKKLESPILH